MDINNDSASSMSHCLIRTEFGGAEYQFGLFLGQWEELQEITNCGPIILFQKLMAWDFRAKWLREIIRLGLIGGGMTPNEASKLVKRYADTVPFAELLPLALRIVGPACFVPDSEIEKKKELAAGGDQTGSNFGSSTETVQ